MKMMIPLLVAASALAATPSFGGTVGELCTPPPVKVRDFTLCRVVKRAGELQCRCKLVNVWQSRSRKQATLLLRRPVYFSLMDPESDPGREDAPATGSASAPGAPATTGPAATGPAATAAAGAAGVVGSATGAVGGVVSGVGQAVGGVVGGVGNAVGGALGRL